MRREVGDGSTVCASGERGEWGGFTCRCDIAEVVRYGWVVHERVGDHLEMLGEDNLALLWIKNQGM